MLGYVIKVKKSNPRIEMTVDTASATVGDLITFVAKPFDISGAVTQVVWKVDGVTVATITDFSSVVEYQTNQLVLGAHTITTETSYFSSKTGQVEVITKDLVIAISDSSHQVVVDYAPPWESSITRLPVDEDGWTDISPKGTDHQFAYVSKTGNDSTGVVYNYQNSTFADYFNPTGESAFATVEAAVAACLRVGESDYVCVERGDDIIQTVALNSVVAGNSNYHHITAYGSGNRPLIKVALSASAFISNYDGNLAITHLDLYSHERDPDSPDFVGWMNLSNNIGIFSYRGSVLAEGLLVEGCRFRHFESGFYISSGNHLKLHTQIVSRRNTFDTLWGGFSIGTYYVDCQYVLQEEITYHKCGYLERYEGVEADDKGKYGDELQTVYGHIKTTVATSLTSSDVVTVELADPLPLNTPIGTELVIITDSNDTRRMPILSFTGSTVTLDAGTYSTARDFSSDNATAGNLAIVRVYGACSVHHSKYFNYCQNVISRKEVSILPASMYEKWINNDEDVTTTLDVSAYDNLIIDGEIGYSIGGNNDVATTPRFVNFDIAYNVFAHIGHTNPSGREIAWAMTSSDHSGSKFRNNLGAFPIDTVAADAKGLTLKRSMTATSFTDNLLLGYDAPYISELLPEQDYTLRGTLVAEPVAGFVNTAVRLEDFTGDVDTDTAIDSFVTSIIDRDINNWVRPDEDYKALVRAGLTTASGLPIIIANPDNVEFADGDTVSFSVDVYSVTGAVSYQWYKGGVAVTGATSATYTATLASSDDESTVYCDVTNSNGTVSTALATLTEISVVNKIVDANDYSTGSWSKLNLTVAYDATESAYKLTGTNTGAEQRIQQSVAQTGSAEAISFDIKADTAQYFGLNLQIEGTWTRLAFDAVSGTFGHPTANNIINYSVQDMGDGWFRCGVSFTERTVNAVTLGIHKGLGAGGHYVDTTGLAVWLRNVMIEDGAVIHGYVAP